MRSSIPGLRFLAALALALSMLAAPAAAQDDARAELDQLLAPIALYPDALLGNVLAASTYPLEVVALHRWLEARPQLDAVALESAVAPQPWDASVKALAPFRAVVAMMNGELEWMQRVGDAFLASQPEVWDAVQRLRQKARDAGTLADTERERVRLEDADIVIEPAAPDVVYVPVYDPRVVYGPWWWPGYPPYVFGGAYWGPLDLFGGIGFGIGIRVRPWYGSYLRPDWRGRNLYWGRAPRPTTWSHNPAHRGGVPYINRVTRERYEAPRAGVPQRRDYRGFEVRPQPPSRGTSADSRRGRESLRPAPSPAARPSTPRSSPQGSSTPRPAAPPQRSREKRG